MKMKIPFFASLEISGGFEAGGSLLRYDLKKKEEKEKKEEENNKNPGTVRTG